MAPMKIILFWIVRTCSLRDRYQHLFFWRGGGRWKRYASLSLLQISHQRHGIRAYETFDLNFQNMHDVTWADTDQFNDSVEVMQIVLYFLAVRSDDTCDVRIVVRRGFV
jgi:hypothetical protein